jgi:hypothetical protein
MSRIQYTQDNRIAGFVREYVYDSTPDFDGFGRAIIDLAPHRANAVTPWPMMGIMPTIPTPVIAAQAGPTRGMRNRYRDYIALATYGDDSQAQVDAWAAQAAQGRGPLATTERHQDGLFDGTQARYEGDRPWMWLPNGPNGPGIY